MPMRKEGIFMLSKEGLDWSNLSATDEKMILQTIDQNWDKLNNLIDEVFAGKKIHTLKLK